MMLPKAAWLLTCWLWHTAVEATPTTTPRPLPTFPVSMADHGEVFLVIPEGPKALGTPGYFRSQGGISEGSLPAPDAETAAEWQRLRNIRPDDSEDSIDFEDLSLVLMSLVPDEAAARRQAWMMLDQRRQPAQAERVWIFRIATGPNVWLGEWQDVLGNPMSMSRALGGLPWSQIINFTELDGTNADVRNLFETLTERDPVVPPVVATMELSWMNNDDYDAAWGNYGSVRGIPHRVFDAPEGMTRMEMARDLMALVTSSRVVPDAQRRQELRELLDWDIDAEPGRDFPLLRHGQPTTLEAAALSRIQWGQVQIPPNIQLALASGLVTIGQCGTALRQIRDAVNKGPKGKRGVVW
ncbi:uncharacterized protein G6M90_00g001370 [Metarhizium brunneum]|uniref:Uncharacterized protein n=1 Tax=Metarhizium brunneum TaxID=500148 RepID=A0A7D5UQ44_9HYPO